MRLPHIKSNAAKPSDTEMKDAQSRNADNDSPKGPRRLPPLEKSEITCLVCSKPTRNTWSACRKFGIDLGFCSPERQQIASLGSLARRLLCKTPADPRVEQAWSEHKKVCGKNANPFRWPPLSASEAQAAIDNLDYRVDDPNVLDFPSLNTLLQKDYRIPKELVPVSRRCPSADR